MSAVTGSACETLVCIKLLLFIVRAETNASKPAAAATSDQKTAENKETKSANAV